ncbi:MAG TPA: phage baseplate assembly protein V [Vicinamibacterales bacterium]|nr:phage baseplate assembly protein V [Vicinamibacterales bacterium]
MPPLRDSLYGVYHARVTDLRDPEARGRINVAWTSEAGAAQAWAPLATLMAGNDRGTWFMPEVDDEVLIAFEAGDPRRPCVIGALWKSKDAPPTRPDAKNTVKMLRTRNGLTITLSDADGQERLSLATPGGQTLTLSDGPGGVELVDSNGNAIRLQPSGITITAAGRVNVQAAQVSVSAGTIDLNAAMVNCSSTLRADSVVTNSVISNSYTPGVGNVW